MTESALRAAGNTPKQIARMLGIPRSAWFVVWKRATGRSSTPAST
jgi:hypothetical protein